jgi:hypothetical protein
MVAVHRKTTIAPYPEAQAVQAAIVLNIEA